MTDDNSTGPSTAAKGRLRLTPDATTALERKPPGERAPREVAVRPAESNVYGLDERFVDEGEIGHGGMGAVHRVLERSLHRTVAMKLLPQDLAQDTKYRNRFLAEAQVTGQLEHPNIVSVYELGTDDDGVMFFTMPLIEGETLSEWLRHRAPLSDEDIEAALDIFFRVCDALSFAHSRGVVHRDIKPANIMVGEHGQVYLMDWGIARVMAHTAVLGDAPEFDVSENINPTDTQVIRRRTTTLTAAPVEEEGVVLGTYAYMAPEQARGDVENIDERTDVFGLGAVLYRVLVGRAPFEGTNAFDSLARAAESRLPEIKTHRMNTLRRALLEVAKSAMRKDPTDRFQNVTAFKNAVQQVLRGRIRFPVRHCRAGDLIVTAGDQGDDAFYIRQGQCEVFVERDGVEHRYETLAAGDVFGETAVFTGSPRNASVRALTDVELISVPGRYLADAVGLDSWLGAFVRTLGNRFSERNQRVAELENDLVQARVALFFQSHPEGPVSMTDLQKAVALPAVSAQTLRIALEELGFDVVDDTVRRPAPEST